MMPTTSRTTILFGLTAIAALAVFFLVSVKRGSRLNEKIVPPVYVQDELPTVLTLEQMESINLSKRLILERVMSKTPLTDEEKQKITLIMATKANIYRFSMKEVEGIYAAFK